MPRNYLNYNGQTSQPFTVMSAFVRDGSRYRFAFDTWRSTADFNNDMNAFAPLHRRVEALPAFATANASLLASLEALLLGEMGLGGRGFTVSNVQWFTVERVLAWRAVEGSTDTASWDKRGADYVSFYTANQALLQNLNAAAWAHAKATDPFFERMTPAV